MNWIPIELPPKEGARVLVWIDLRGEHVGDRSYARVACWDGERWRDGHGGPFLEIEPAYWCPLDPPRVPHGTQQ